MMRHRGTVVLALAGLSAACTPTLAPPTPDVLHSLEAAHARRPGDADLALALAEAYYGIGRYEAALTLCEQVAAIQPENEEAALFQAFTLDTLGQYAEARNRYQWLDRRVGSARVRRAIAARLTILEPRVRADGLREAVANGVWLGVQGAAFGVLPLRYRGSDTTLSGIGVGLAQYLADDLERPAGGRADTVEFERLLDLRHALRIADDALEDPATATRLGQMLKVRLMLQGSVELLDSATLRVRAQVVDVPSGEVVATMVVDTAVGQVAGAGLEMVADARASATSQPPTPRVFAWSQPRVEALVALGRGLESSADGDLASALPELRRAVLLAPAWGSARSIRDKVSVQLAPPPLDPRRLAEHVNGPTTHATLRDRLRLTVASVAPGRAEVTTGVSPDLANIMGRKPVAEATGSLGPERAAGTAIRIIISLHLMRVP